MSTPQVNQRRGVVEIEFGGRLRTFKFGMNTLVAFGQLYADTPGEFGEQFTKNPILALRDMAYCGLLVRKAENDLPENFSSEMVGEWVDEMERQEDWQLVVDTMLGAMALGNPNRANLSKAARNK